MKLELEDERLSASVKLLGNGMVRLTLDYPFEDEYRDLVNEGLCNLLRYARERPKQPSSPALSPEEPNP